MTQEVVDGVRVYEVWAEQRGEDDVVDLDLGALERCETSRYVRYVKPAVERPVALLLLLVTLPFACALAVSLRINLGRAVLLRQERVGRYGVPFCMYKFRTMLPDRRVHSRPISTERRACHKTVNDPRHTRIGRALRAASLDELPQLWNVVKGDMALVGPRPELPAIVGQYEPWQHYRHLLRPGLTGPWQISGRGSGELMHTRTDIDLDYVREISFATDARILFRTFYGIVVGHLRGT